MRLTAAEQLALGVIDEVVPEPEGGAHENPEEMARRLRARIAAHLDTLAGRDRKALVDARYARYRQMGEFAVATPTGEPQPERPGMFNRIRRVLERRPRRDRRQCRGTAQAMTDGDEQPPLREDV